MYLYCSNIIGKNINEVTFIGFGSFNGSFFASCIDFNGQTLITNFTGTLIFLISGVSRMSIGRDERIS